MFLKILPILIDIGFFLNFFRFFFIEFIIQFDRYFIENIQLVISSTILYKLIFDVFFQAFFEYIYQYNIILFGTVGLSLEFCNIFCCRFYLLYFLNSLFHNSIFVGDTEDSIKIFLEDFPIFKKYFYIDVAGIF